MCFLIKKIKCYKLNLKIILINKFFENKILKCPKKFKGLSLDELGRAWPLVCNEFLTPAFNSVSFNFPTPALLNWPFCVQITNLAPASEVAGGHTLPF
jgi:hypothetical protein